jgi:predicted acetylornithine/succinylornithine family transaminase
MNPVITDYEKYVVPSYARSLVITHGKGTEVWDDAGKRYLDFGGGIAVNCLGHAPQVVAETLHRQASELIHTSNLYYHAKQGELAHRLVDLTGPGKIFFCNSGAESNECLYKLARRFGDESGKFEIITSLNSFHGRTLAGIAATGQEKIKKGFGPMMPGFVHVPFNDLEAVRKAVTPQTVAVLIEGIQGESGVYPASPEFLLGLRKLCDEQKLLLMMDCVQCGMFRTGKFMSYESILENHPEGKTFLPDAISMAKSLGSGFPIGAAWIRTPYADLLQPGSHGTTYGGTPLACSVALAVLDTIQKNNLPAHIEATGKKIIDALSPLKNGPHLREIRGMGGMIGLETDRTGAEMATLLREDGLMVAPAGGNNFRLLPPYNVKSNEIEETLVILKRRLS